MLKKTLKIIIVFVVGVVGGIFADQILWPYFVERPLFFEYDLDQPSVYIRENKEVHVLENTALKEALSKVEKVVVGIETKDGQIEGSGLIVTSDGLIVTFSDFFLNGIPTHVYFNGNKYSPEIVKTEDGLALIKIGANNLPTAGFASLNSLDLGERVFLVGSFFDGESFKKRVNEGIVKYFNPNLISANIQEEKVLKGSTLFDIEGNILGLNLINSAGEIDSVPIFKIRNLLEF